MNILPRDKQIEAISALCEGVSIRATERLTDIHRDTIMRLGVRVGEGCARLHDQLMRDLHVGRLELDEIWSYVGKKRRRLRPVDDPEKGDQYIFVALASSTKAIIGYRVGKRNDDTAEDLCLDLRRRVLGVSEISTDGYPPYLTAIRRTFGAAVHHGQIIKKFAGEPPVDAARRYSPGIVVAVDREVVTGFPSRISTSYVERSNLSMRMGSRRLTRLTNGFSKKFTNHVAAISLYVAHYNFCRVHETLRATPAVAQGIADHVWTIGELLDAALGFPLPKPEGQKVGRFRVIEGGRS
jgi:IS1 family transposase